MWTLGCTTNPGTKNKYCTEHKHLQQPCVSSNSLDTGSVKLLNDSRNQKSATIGDDSVFVIEGSSHSNKSLHINGLYRSPGFRN